MGTLQWAPRLVALGVSLFLAVFALDEIGNAIFPEAIFNLIIHLLPSAIVLAVVALSWRREWIGAAAFIALAVAYAIAAQDHLSWVAVISGPLVLTGALYAWNWTHRAVATR